MTLVARSFTPWVVFKRTDRAGKTRQHVRLAQQKSANILFTATVNPCKDNRAPMMIMYHLQVQSASYETVPKSTDAGCYFEGQC